MGVLGFSVLGPVEYFNGVVAHLENTFFPNVKVATAHVNPVGSVAERADALARFIVHVAGNERVCIFAHSMGGLDVRFAFSNNLFRVAEHIRTVVMIGTPHLGSPVADAIEKGDPAVLRDIPLPIRVELGISQRALHDLTTAQATKADAAMDDVPGINYVHVAGDMAQE
jgi:alpha-beta hydrolase superfamily lysophospholipase